MSGVQSIKSWFKPITREEIEIQNLLLFQESRHHAEDQKMILIIDLHYSHTDALVLALMRASNIIPIYIPAGCTDIHQVGDVVVNKPYKNGVTAANKPNQMIGGPKPGKYSKRK